MKIICFSGKARAGKDESAHIMQKILWGDGETVLIMHFGDLVKYICKQYFGWDGKKDEKGRSLLQYVGTDVVRMQDPGHWVKFVADFAHLFVHKWHYLLIPDLRFPNEIQVLSDRGFDVTHIHIERDQENDLTEKQRNHPSETAMDGVPYDYLVNNNGTISELTKQLLLIEKDIVSHNTSDAVDKEVVY